MPRIPLDIPERFSVLTQDPLVCVICDDLSGKVVFFNEKARQIFGYTEAEALGRPVVDFFESVTRDELNVTNSAEARRKNGTTFTAKPLTFSLGGGPDRVTLRCFRDHSDRQRLEAELRYGKAFAQALQEVAVAANEARSVEDALGVMLRVIGTYSGSAVGRVAMLADGETSEMDFLRDRAFAEKGSPAGKFAQLCDSVPERIRWGIGLMGRALATQEVSWSPELADLATPEVARHAKALGMRSGFAIPIVSDGRTLAVMGFLCVSRQCPDGSIEELTRFISSQLSRVIERKSFEQEMIRAREAAIEASSAKSRFLANMSHEFRTPLNAMTGMAHLLMRTQLDEEQAEYARTMIRSSDALLSLINDVLDFSKIEAGKLDLKVSDFSLDSLFRDTTAILNYDAIQKGIALVTSIDSDVPLAVRGDPGRLRQVLVNLIGNAIKFTEKGKVHVRISRLRKRPGLTWIRFEVADTGIGIPPESRDKIFGAFSQVDGSSTRRHSGTGLGLSISKRLVELMGGEIGFDTETSRGSTFWFDIALQEQTAEGETKPRGGLSAFPAALAPATVGLRRVLVAEDNLVSQKMVARMLQNFGYETIGVTKGGEAVQAVLDGRCDLVLMDCQMPEMDGFEATRQIRALSVPARGIPVIAMTANALKGDRERCLASGMDDYIAKPLDPERLAGLIGEYLTPAESHLDSSVLGRLRRINREGEPDVVHELAEIFFETSPARLTRIRESFLRHDASTLAREAHNLGSAGASLGATQLFNICQELDGLGRAGTLPQVTPQAAVLVERLERSYQIFSAHLRREIAEL